MIAKEWRDARWKLAIATAIVVVAVLAAPIPTPYQEIKQIAKQSTGYQITETTITGKDAPGVASTPEELGIAKEATLKRTPVTLAVQEMWSLYSAGGFIVLLPLAGLLGATMVSVEVSGGTISLLLSRPVSRNRVLLTKYGVGAGVLLVAAMLGGTLVFALAAARGYPLGELSAVGIASSAALMWLGSLFVLGVALLMSVLLRSVISSLVATVLAVVLVFVFPGPFLDYSLWVQYHSFGISEQMVHALMLPQYWYSKGLYAGQSLVPGHFLVSSVAAAVPLILAFWNFRRRAY